MRTPERLTHALLCLLLAMFAERASADLQIVTSNTVQGAVAPGTNRVVTKVRLLGLRRDMDGSSSVLVFADRPEQIQLFHETRTYTRQIGPQNGSAAPAAPKLTPGDPIPFGLFTAKPFSWTNGLDSGRIWVAPLNQVTDLPASLLASPPGSTNSSVFRSPGSMYDKDSMVVGIEVTRAIQAFIRGLTGPISAPAQVTNLSYTMTSTLISITLTNLSPSEFEIPKDYREVPATANVAQDAPMPPPIDPSRLGYRPPAGNLEWLRKEFENGAAPLSLPFKTSQ